ncbi:MAG: LysM peptidoglycan-binding domain-containing protein [Desulfotignum sp.]|nr:LysM peptidoglycan-binding domain-containing protein [Desulfotignum sp.]MCF8126422.1 LysM peptidoglycan-binding domain-containing protein [Desulfotignum sp.]
MKHKDKSDSKIATTQTNTNKKKAIKESDPLREGSSLFKKNESTVIIAGALAVTLIVFFIFFRSSGPDTQEVSSLPENARIEELAQQLASLELSLTALDKKIAAITGDTDTNRNAALAQIRKQVSTLEKGVLVKVDSLADRMKNLEQTVSALEKTGVAVAPEARETTPKVKKPSEIQGKETDSLFHTVKKGETLWRISREYDTTVAKLRQLNNLAPDADIYPGKKILVR